MRARFSNFAICLILPKRHLLSFLLYFKFLKLKADGVMSRKANTIVQATRFMKKILECFKNHTNLTQGIHNSIKTNEKY